MQEAQWVLLCPRAGVISEAPRSVLGVTELTKNALFLSDTRLGGTLISQAGWLKSGTDPSIAGPERYARASQGHDTTASTYRCANEELG